LQNNIVRLFQKRLCALKFNYSLEHDTNLAYAMAEPAGDPSPCWKTRDFGMMP
jgi:hypothetical protein